MCFPQMFAAMTAGELFGAGSTLSTFGTFISAISSVAQGVAGQQAANAQAAAYENQAKVKAAQSEQALEKAQMEAAILRERGQKITAAQRAAMGASGVTTDSPTSLNLLADTTYGVESDVSMLKYNAMLEAWGFQTEAEALKTQAKSAKQQGRYAMLGGVLGAGQSLLTGAAMTAERTLEGMSSGLLDRTKRGRRNTVLGSTSVVNGFA